MARQLALGESGEIEVTPQFRDAEGVWRVHLTGKGKGVERWRARAYYRGWDGVLRDVTRVVRNDSGAKARAVKACEDAVAERLRVGSGATASGSQQLVGLRDKSGDVVKPGAGDAWLVLIARSDSGKAPKTVADYGAAWKRYVAVDGSSLRGLTLAQANEPARVRAFLQAVADEHGTAAAKMAKSVLSGIFNQAVTDGALSTNSTRQVRPVKAQREREGTGTGRRNEDRDTTRALTREERDRLLAYGDERAAIEGLNPRTARKRATAADLLAFMAGTGVRITEARALRWKHVDPEAGTVDIHGTKSKGARRRLNLPPWLAERLQVRREAGEGVGYVFPAPSSADPERQWEQSNCAGEVAAVLKGAGLSWATPHTLRRTVATRLHEAGVPIAKIADQLGHADPAMTASVYLGRDFEGDKSDLAAHL